MAQQERLIRSRGGKEGGRKMTKKLTLKRRHREKSFKKLTEENNFKERILKKIAKINLRKKLALDHSHREASSQQGSSSPVELGGGW